jgi:hypothetical protein
VYRQSHRAYPGSADGVRREGFPKKYTAEEQKALKGPDSKLPGYASDFDKLKTGQTVQLTLVKPKVDKDAPIGQS